MPDIGGGFQPDTKSPSARRADFDLLRRIALLERTGGGGEPGEAPNEVTIGEGAPVDESELWVDPTPTPTLYALIGGTWTAVSTGGGGGTTTSEIEISTSDPIAINPLAELWYDPDAAGPDPGSAGFSYVHNQSAPAAIWTIVHDLGWYPNVTVIDSGGAVVEGDIIQTNADTMTLTFSGAFAGIAYLS